MASAKGYDENLLSQAPEVTRADLQDGYNADLLRETSVKRNSSVTRAAPTPPVRTNSDTLQYHIHDKDRDVESSAAPLQPKEAANYTQSRKQPWWRTVKGIAIIVVVVIVIILAAVLGGVLGSRKSGRSSGGNQADGEVGSTTVSGQVGSSPVESPSTGSSSAVPPATSQPTQPSSVNGGGNTEGQGSGGAGAAGGAGANGAGGGGGSPVVGGGAGAALPRESGVNDGRPLLSRRDAASVVEMMLRDLGVDV